MVKNVFVGVMACLFVFALGSAALAYCDPEDPNVICYGPTIDHYRCYKVKDRTDPKMEKIEGVSLNDPGDPNATIEVKPKMKYACAPTDKEGEGVINDVEWLCGYKIKGDKIDPRPQKVLTNQFQFPAEVELIKSFLLLVPCADPNVAP